MANLTPSEMRETAKRLREGRFLEQGAWRTSDIGAGAGALDRLSDVIEYAEKHFAWLSQETALARLALDAVLSLARGETTNKEER